MIVKKKNDKNFFKDQTFYQGVILKKSGIPPIQLIFLEKKA